MRSEHIDTACGVAFRTAARAAPKQRAAVAFGGGETAERGCRVCTRLEAAEKGTTIVRHPRKNLVSFRTGEVGPKVLLNACTLRPVAAPEHSTVVLQNDSVQADREATWTRQEGRKARVSAGPSDRLGFHPPQTGSACLVVIRPEAGTRASRSRRMGGGEGYGEANVAFNRRRGPSHGTERGVVGDLSADGSGERQEENSGEASHLCRAQDADKM